MKLKTLQKKFFLRKILVKITEKCRFLDFFILVLLIFWWETDKLAKKFYRPSQICTSLPKKIFRSIKQKLAKKIEKRNPPGELSRGGGLNPTLYLDFYLAWPKEKHLSVIRIRIRSVCCYN